MRDAYLEFLSLDKWQLLASAFAEDAPGVFSSPDRVLNHLHAFEALFGAIEQRDGVSLARFRIRNGRWVRWFRVTDYEWLSRC